MKTTASRTARAVVLAVATLGATASGQAGVLAEATRHSFTDYCSRSSPLTAAQQHRLLRVAEIVRRELQASGADVALVSRAGTDLKRFGQRFSHAGLSLREGTELPWAVRQLYYACDEKRPRLFDQGLAGFLMGTDDPTTGHLSLVLLPPGEATEALRRVALDKLLALGLVSPRYSANAYAFSSRYQNCNQWLAELMGVAWGGLAGSTASLRDRAQQWLKQADYQPQAMPIGSHALMMAAPLIPMVYLDDHPEEDRFALRLQVSMPSSLEAFVRQRLPQARRIALCHAEGRVVIRRDGSDLPDACRPEPGDEVVALD